MPRMLKEILHCVQDDRKRKIKYGGYEGRDAGDDEGG